MLAECRLAADLIKKYQQTDINCSWRSIDKTCSYNKTIDWQQNSSKTCWQIDEIEAGSAAFIDILIVKLLLKNLQK